MPVSTDKMTALKEHSPFLTHTSLQGDLKEIKAHPDSVDQFGRNVGRAVFATDSDLQREFYALRSRGGINWAKNYLNGAGHVFCRIYIFDKIREKLNDDYFEYQVPSENFVCVVSPQGKLSGEWISHESVKLPDGYRPRHGKKKDVLQKTSALVFSIEDMKKFEAQNVKVLLADEQMNDLAQASDIIKKLVTEGILVPANPGTLLARLSKFAAYKPLTRFVKDAENKSK